MDVPDWLSVALDRLRDTPFAGEPSQALAQASSDLAHFLQGLTFAKTLSPEALGKVNTLREKVAAAATPQTREGYIATLLDIASRLH